MNSPSSPPPLPEPTKCAKCGIEFNTRSTPQWCASCLGWLCDVCSATDDLQHSQLPDSI